MSLELLDPPESSDALAETEWKPPRRRARQSMPTFPSDQSIVVARPVQYRFGNERVFQFDETPPDWALETIRQICSLGELAANWDSYGARPVDPQIALTAIEIWLAAGSSTVAPPAVVPTVRGAIQLEWHRRGIDLELEIAAPNRAHMSFENSATGEEFQQNVRGDFAPITATIQRLSNFAT